MVLVTDRAIWSDEVEMLARFRADVLTWLTKKPHKWESLLPERFVASATQPNIPSQDEMKGITRGLSKMLDGLAAMLSKKQGEILQ